MVKIAVLILALVAGYFLFIHDKLPSQITFHGHTLEKDDKEVFERNGGKFALYKYSARSSHHYLIFIVSENGAPVPVDDITEFYTQRLKQQRIKLTQDRDGRYYGVRDEPGDYITQAYMTQAIEMNAVILFLQYSDKKSKSKQEAQQIFQELEDYTLG